MGSVESSGEAIRRSFRLGGRVGSFESSGEAIRQSFTLGDSQRVAGRLGGKAWIKWQNKKVFRQGVWQWLQEKVDKFTRVAGRLQADRTSDCSEAFLAEL